MTPQWLQGAPLAIVRQAKVLHLSGVSLALSQSWSHAQGPAVVVLKMGADGVWLSHAGQRQHIPSLPVPQVVDATGAGDCFCGNLLTRFAMGHDWLTSARYANAAASLAVQGRGAVAPLPQSAAVLALLGL